MRKRLMTGTLIGALAAYACPVLAGDVQMIPPTPIGAMTPCVGGLQQVLAYSGADRSSGQAGMNCVPVTTDAQGDMQAGGFIQVGTTSAACNAARAGAISFNPATNAFQGCNGSGWQALGGGSTGKLYWDGNWTGDHYWCDSGFHVVGFHYDCGCSNNATWFECQAN